MIKHYWEYHGGPSWSDIIDWCLVNWQEDEYSYHHGMMLFYRDEEYVAFLLRWA